MILLYLTINKPSNLFFTGWEILKLLKFPSISSGVFSGVSSGIFSGVLSLTIGSEFSLSIDFEDLRFFFGSSSEDCEILRFDFFFVSDFSFLF